MKKFLWLLIAVILLTGCAQQTEPEESSIETTVPAPTGLYIPDSEAEKTTKGALRAYEINGGQVFPVKDGVAIWNDRSELIVMDRQEGMILATVPDVSDLRLVTEDTVYYCNDTGLVAYQWQTAQTSSWQLPKDMLGDFAIGEKTREIYYCNETQVMALHMDTGIKRMIRQHSYTLQVIQTALFGGEVLAWDTEDGVLFISTENGMTLEEEPVFFDIQTKADAYMLYRQDGIVEQWIYGQRQGTPVQLNISALVVRPDFARNGVVTLDMTDPMKLDYYDVTTGRRIAALSLSLEETCMDMMADGTYVWILTDRGLYRWDINGSAVSDENDYTGTVWTADAPDAEALSQCRAYADRLTEIYGVEILFGKEAVADAPQPMEPEYQAPALQQMLEELEQALQQLPEGFAKTVVQYGSLHIRLVRQVPDKIGYSRYWRGNGCYLVLTPYMDCREGFLSALGGAIETRILGNSRDLEYWDKHNPVGFQYTYGEAVREEALAYIPMFFTDEIAMTYPTEDRARVFCYAMTEACGEMFASEPMQNKLRLLCEGIREAYDLKQSTQEFPWEQYLEESLAYVEKKK